MKHMYELVNLATLCIAMVVVTRLRVPNPEIIPVFVKAEIKVTGLTSKLCLNPSVIHYSTIVAKGWLP